MAEDRYYATGKRKTTVARVWLKPGEGTIEINKRSFENYFPRESLRMTVLHPFELTKTVGQFDVFANVKGEGSPGKPAQSNTASPRPCSCTMINFARS